MGVLSIGLARPTPVILKANRGAETILGYSRAEIVDFPFTMFLADEDNYPVTGAIRRLFAEGGRTFNKKINIIQKKRQPGDGDPRFEPPLFRKWFH